MLKLLRLLLLLLLLLLQILALGFVSVFDQIMEGLDEGERAKVWNAYVGALGEDPSKFRVSATAANTRLLGRSRFHLFS